MTSEKWSCSVVSFLIDLLLAYPWQVRKVPTSFVRTFGDKAPALQVVLQSRFWFRHKKLAFTYSYHKERLIQSYQTVKRSTWTAERTPGRSHLGKVEDGINLCERLQENHRWLGGNSVEGIRLEKHIARLIFRAEGNIARNYSVVDSQSIWKKLFTRVIFL